MSPNNPFWTGFASVDPTGADLTLEDLHGEPTIYLLAEAGSDPEAATHLEAVCDQIFEDELDALVSRTRGVAR